MALRGWTFLATALWLPCAAACDSTSIAEPGAAGATAGGSAVSGGSDTSGVEGSGGATSASNAGAGNASGGSASGGSASGGSASGGTTSGSAGRATVAGQSSTGGQVQVGGAPPEATGGTGMAGAPAGGDPCLDFSDPEVIGELDTPVGPSGMVASRANPGVVYVHGDAGDEVAFYAVDTSGARLARVALTGAMHRDWEDAAIGPGPGGMHTMYLGDIGDNAARTGSGSPRDEIRIYRFVEPSIDVEQPAAR